MAVTWCRRLEGVPGEAGGGVDPTHTNRKGKQLLNDVT